MMNEHMVELAPNTGHLNIMGLEKIVDVTSTSDISIQVTIHYTDSGFLQMIMKLHVKFN